MNRRRRHLPDSKMLLAQLASTRVSKLGIAMLETPGGYMLEGGAQGDLFRTKHAAMRAWLAQNPRAYGWKGQHYVLRRGVTATRFIPNSDEAPLAHWRGWFLRDPAGNEIARWLTRPSRSAIAACIRKARAQDSRPSWKRPDTLGWRGWRWDTRRCVLVSPNQATPWPDRECRVENWSEASVVRGHAGIHACRLPRGDWRNARRPVDMLGTDVIGLVERFGRYVLGEQGWRAEWVIIKELMAPDEATAKAIRDAYPDIPVCVAPPTHWLHNFI